MWNLASKCLSGSMGLKKDALKLTLDSLDCSDDETSSNTSREEGLECPICWEVFNMVENVPYVLWCGHTLCKNCVLGLQWTVVKFPTLPVQLPLFISCPWCNLLSPRLVYRGNLKFPRKNFFLLWMLESMNGERERSHFASSGDHQPVWPSNATMTMGSSVNPSNLWRGQSSQHLDSSGSTTHEDNRVDNYLSVERLHSSIKTSLAFFVHLTAKFPLVFFSVLIILYVIPASAAVLALYLLITVLFALPAFLILYFSYPSLDWLVREIIT